MTGWRMTQHLQGWKSTVIQMNSFGKIASQHEILAPDGRYCSFRSTL